MKAKKGRQNAKAQTVVKMSGANGQTREQQVKKLDEVKSRSEPQKKPQVSQQNNPIPDVDTVQSTWASSPHERCRGFIYNMHYLQNLQHKL